MQSAQPLPNSAPAAAADPTTQPIAGHWRLLVRASGFEELRALMAEVGADQALLQLSADELLSPVFDSEGPTFKVVARSQQAVPEFVQFANRHRWLTVDDLLVVRHLTTHREMTGREAADLCQRRPSEMHVACNIELQTQGIMYGTP